MTTPTEPQLDMSKSVHKKHRTQINQLVSRVIHLEQLISRQSDDYQTLFTSFAEELKVLKISINLANDILQQKEDKKIAFDALQRDMKELQEEVIFLRSSLQPKMHPIMQSLHRLYVRPMTEKGKQVDEDTQVLGFALKDVLKECDDAKKDPDLMVDPNGPECKERQEQLAILYGKIKQNFQLIRSLNRHGDVVFPEDYSKEITSTEKCHFKACMIDPSQPTTHDPHEPIHPQGNPGTNVAQELAGAFKSFTPFKIETDHSLEVKKQMMTNLKRNLKAANIEPIPTPLWKMQCLGLGLETYEELQHHYRDAPEECPKYE